MSLYRGRQQKDVAHRVGDAAMRAYARGMLPDRPEDHCFVIGSIGVYYDGERMFLRLITRGGQTT